MLTKLFLLVLLISPSFSIWYTSAPGTSAIDKARTFQSALNRAISRQDERGVNYLVSNWFVHDKCTGRDGDKRTFVQQLLSERKLGVVTSATDTYGDIHFVVNYGTQRRKCTASEHEDQNLPRMLMVCRDLC